MNLDRLDWSEPFMKMFGFKCAKKESLKSDNKHFKLGACVIYKGSVLAVGHNSEKTHTIQHTYNSHRGFDPSKYPCKLHAEMMALNKIQFLDIDFSCAEVYIWRGVDGPQLSRPCKACEARIRDMGIKKIYYTGNNSYCYEKYA